MQQYTIHYHSRLDMEEIKAFYQKTPYRNTGSITADDKIVTAEVQGMTVGMLRLCMEQGILVLRGFNVLPDFQGGGVGTALLQEAIGRIDSEHCYLICKRGLNAFYSRAGFSECLSDVPPFLAARRSAYAHPDLNILVYTRPLTC